MSISELKNRIRQDIPIIDNPDGAAELLDVSAQMLRKQFRMEAHDRLWMFILKEKIAHFMEHLHPYPTKKNRQFLNAEKVIDLYCSVLPGPDRNGPEKLDSFSGDFKCTAAPGYAARFSGFRL